MIVAGDPVETEQRLAVRPSLSLLQTTLVRQERRALQEEQGKRRQADISHRIPRVASLSEVRQRVAAPAQRPDETIQDFHAPDKPPFRGCENPQKRSSTFPIKLPRSTGSIETQFQSHLELLGITGSG